MNIENEIFKKSVINYGKLIEYGFKKENNEYKISKNILNDSFSINIEISELGVIKVKIYDLAFNEEYVNYKIEKQNGEFVNKVREELKKFLLDIKKNCTTTNYFITNQANRITKLIIQKYNNLPEFPWDNLSGSGIFRNPDNKKWYALIMNINKNKLDTLEDKEVEILNVKLEPSEIKKLLKIKGFYKAYHMNKENWITIILDNTVSDSKIMECIEKSHNFTIKK